LPKKIRTKVGRRTVIRRLGEKGFKPERKIQKSDPGPALCKKRISFGKKNADKTGADWSEQLQAVGDFKDFTWYPKSLMGKFKRLRAPWTYMTKKEKKLPAFVRPKRWFPKKEYLKAKKQKVFGVSTSSGKSLAFLVPKPFDSVQWAREVKKRLVPFFKKAFPGKTSFSILLDGEKLLHAPAARAAMKQGGIKIFPNWPKYSPDLKPQENVWAWAEPELRKLEGPNDSFEVFQKKTLKAVMAYPSTVKLIPSMARRCKTVAGGNGAMLDN